MARPERPLDPSAGPLALLATELRKLRGKQTYSELSRKTHLSPSTLNSAAGGMRLPSWEVTRAFAAVSDGDEHEIRRLWEDARASAGRDVTPGHRPAVDTLPVPEPGLATSPAEFVELMTTLRKWAGNPSLAELNKRAGWLLLPPSTVSETLRRKDRLPRLELVSAFVRACGLNDDQVTAWEQAWGTLRAQELLPSQALPASLQQPPSPAERLQALLRAGRRNARDFVTWMSGARLEVLRLSPSDRAAYTGLGWTILTTGALAAASLALALHVVLNTATSAAWLLGITFGAAIAGLDRFIVTSTHRGRLDRKILTILPRIVLAVLTGAVISTPIVMEIYAPDIAAQVVSVRQAQASQFTNQVNNSALGREIQDEKNALTVHQAIANRAYEAWQCELYGDGCSQHTVSGSGSVARARQLQYQTAIAEVQQDQAALTALQKQEQQLQSQYTTANRQRAGLLTRLEALNQLANQNALVKTSWILIFVLLSMLECLPVTVRMVQLAGPWTPYDRILELQQLSDIRLASKQIRAESGTSRPARETNGTAPRP